MPAPIRRDDERDPAAAPASSAALRARGLSRRIGKLEVVDAVDLDVGEREVVALVGPSGCGKSTILELVCGLQAPDLGELAVRPAALMPQRDLLLPWLDARDNVALPLRLAGASRRDARARAGELLERVDLAGFARSRPDQLSGGMRQRVSFLRALATERDLLCLDEPFGALDAITREELQTWLAELLDARARSVLLVTHDVEEAVLLSDRVVVLTPRPARVAATIVVGPPRDADATAEVARRRRDPTDPEIVAARRAVRDALHAAIAADAGTGGSATGTVAA